MKCSIFNCVKLILCFIFVGNYPTVGAQNIHSLLKNSIERRVIQKKSEKTKEKKQKKVEDVSKDVQLAKDEVQLTVSGEGVNKEEATLVALRDALAQAYGTFISSKTEVLNDELIKDEIVSISNGNIKKYNYISENELPNGNIHVTLNTIVSIGNLTNYCQSKGMTIEFGGANFGMNLKIKKLNQSNEEKIVEQLISSLNLFHVFDYKMNVGDAAMANDANYVTIPIAIEISTNDNMKSFYELLTNTLEGVSIKDTQEYKNSNLPIYEFCLSTYFRPAGYNPRGNNHTEEGENIQKFYLRSEKSIILLSNYIYTEINKSIFGFEITDNLNNISSISLFKPQNEIERVGGYRLMNNPLSINHRTIGLTWEGFLKGNGLFSTNENKCPFKLAFEINSQKKFKNNQLVYLDNNDTGIYAIIPHFNSTIIENKNWCYRIYSNLYIPKDDIGNYSKFEIRNDKK